MSGFKKESELDKKIKTIINENEVVKLIKRYKKIKKFKKSNLHLINQLDGKRDIIQELMDEYMESTGD